MIREKGKGGKEIEMSFFGKGWDSCLDIWDNCDHDITGVNEIDTDDVESTRDMLSRYEIAKFNWPGGDIWLTR